MAISESLKPFQYAIGDVIFGAGTEYPVDKVDIQSYNVQAQDSQAIRSNEITMGIETEQAGPIVFTMGVKDNYALDRVVTATGGHLPADLLERQGRLLTALQKEWKAEEVKSIWGQLKPLLVCGRDGVVKRIYGRPRKFTYSRQTKLSQFYTVQAEYARVDTKAHNDIEWVVEVAPGGSAVTPFRDETMGDADAWLRMLLTGPFTHPVITFGSTTIELDMSLATGKALEISSYPWARRIIDSDGFSWRAKAIGNTPYLDKIKFASDSSAPLSWTATGTSGTTGLQLRWRDAYHVI